MKVSNYSFLFSTENYEFYIYNTLSNALIEIDNDTYNILLKARQNKSEVSEQMLDSDLYNTLCQKKFITNNEQDDFLLYKSIVLKQRADKYHIHMTVAPTMDCCFNCHYCFEKFKAPDYMSEAIMDSIVLYLKNLDSKPQLRITWFGGEPLMALPQMEMLYDKISTSYQKPKHSDIITTGFHITPQAIEILKKIGIESMQITLDGLKDTHNRIKTTHNCDDVFGKVMDNVDLLLKNTDIHLIFRVNLTKRNAHEFVYLYKYLSSRFSSHLHKIGICPAFVMDRGDCNLSDDEIEYIFTHDEDAMFALDLYNKDGIATQYTQYPSRFFNECAIRNIMSIAFDPQRYAYKCWEVIGNRKHAFARLNQNGLFEEFNEVILNRHLFGADPLEDPKCSQCAYLPICNGGCPIQRIQNVFECRKNCTCTHFKGHMADFLKIHLRLTKAGFDNHS